ncbi:hypothetical protein [Sphingomonas sp.]|uniref:hypothetical protein n=1 Tax=Sphingomonas sp. TaxID=28214 RepID=UPI001B105BD0|nr:hypothetical protein [Sphingomonas sp.]MBO9714942.1 hypothetical protein [Sphingomonas sp.]
MRQYLLAGAGALVVALIGAWILFARSPAPPPKPPTPPKPVEYGQVMQNMFDFQKGLAAAVQSRYPDPGLEILPTDDSPPIGTLYRPGLTMEANDHSCVPEVLPQGRGTTTFVSYQAGSNLAASLGVDQGVLQALDQAGAKVDQGHTTVIRFDEQSRVYLDDDRLSKVLEQPDCVRALAQGPFEMVRGYFRAKRVFQLSAAVGSGMNAARVATFEARRTSNASIDLSDLSPVAILQLRTRISAKPTTISPAAMPVSTPAPAAGSNGTLELLVDNPTVAGRENQIRLTISKPVAVQRQGMIYVHRDIADRSGRDQRAVALLRGLSLPVVSKIEQIASAKMPGRGQVRYFNPQDAAKAAHVAVALKGLGSFELAPIALTAPSGQLEIWLPKAQ